MGLVSDVNEVALHAVKRVEHLVEFAEVARNVARESRLHDLELLL